MHVWYCFVTICGLHSYVPARMPTHTHTHTQRYLVFTTVKFSSFQFRLLLSLRGTLIYSSGKNTETQKQHLKGHETVQINWTEHNQEKKMWLSVKKCGSVLGDMWVEFPQHALNIVLGLEVSPLMLLVTHELLLMLMWCLCQIIG